MALYSQPRRNESSKGRNEQTINTHLVLKKSPLTCNKLLPSWAEAGKYLPYSRYHITQKQVSSHILENLFLFSAKKPLKQPTSTYIHLALLASPPIAPPSSSPRPLIIHPTCIRKISSMVSLPGAAGGGGGGSCC